MLVLSRKVGQGIVIGHGISVTVLEVRGGQVRLGFNGPAEVPIHREEIHEKISAAARDFEHAGCVCRAVA